MTEAQIQNTTRLESVSGELVHSTGMLPQKHLPAEYYDKWLSDTAKMRKPNAIRSLFALERRPGMISLLAGKPNPTTFPFVSFNMIARSAEDPSQNITHLFEGEELEEGLQYGETEGLPVLLEWLYGLQELSHDKVKGEGEWGITVGNGAQDVIYKAANAILDPGDVILVESPVYAGVIPIFETLRCIQIEVETDAHGVKSSSIREILENWPEGKQKPKALYTIPYGCNPTGMSASLERRKEVLQLAREHDFLIFEDDPYYYLYFGDAPRADSYLKLELQEPEVGRVIRFDSMSKVLSAGLRIGFVSGPQPIITAIVRHSAASYSQISSFTQVIINALLRKWGYDGFFKHTQNVCKFYREKRDIFEAAMQRHMKGLAEWVKPEAGLFYWFKLILDPTSAVECDSESVIRTKALERNVLALPGTVFLPSGRTSAYVRVSFSVNSEGDIDEAVQRLAQVVIDTREAISVVPVVESRE